MNYDHQILVTTKYTGSSQSFNKARAYIYNNVRLKVFIPSYVNMKFQHEMLLADAHCEL